MDHGSPPNAAATAHLRVVKTTLRRLYAPAHESHPAIDQALAMLTRLERGPALERASLLAPAA